MPNYTVECHHQDDSFIKTGSDEGHFNVSLIYREGQSHNDSVHRPQLLKREEIRSGIEPRSFYLPAYNALPLGQTGSMAIP